MGLVSLILSAAASLTAAAMDIAFLLLFIRIVRPWSRNKMLIAFDKAGAPAVNRVCELVGSTCASLGLGPLSTKWRLLLAILVLVICRWLVSMAFVMVG